MTFIKICGLTTTEDAFFAAEQGADYLGFIFYEKSPRHADPTVVTRIMGAFQQEHRYKTLVGVGVFVNPNPLEAKQRINDCLLTVAQAHKMQPADLYELRKLLYGAVYPAYQPRSLDEAYVGLDLVDNDHRDSLMRTPKWCPQLLIDAYHPELHGGTGLRADFEIARAMAQRIPRLVLAGGLTPDNVGEAIRAVRPHMVDVASGVESAPGKKDHGKVKAFIQAVRETEKDLNAS